jgi:DNA-directed RNA polymerase specialized sigma24 family protein
MQDKPRHPDWPEVVFDPDFMAAISKLADKRFGSGSLAEEASTHVIEYLSANDWEKCQSYQGKSQPKTFLFTLSHNALEEFSRKRFGRPRPPTWLQELGELWIKLWRSLCLERQPLPTLIDRYSQKEFREPDSVAQAARVIKARIPTCGQSSRDSELSDDIDRLSDATQAEQADACSETPDFENPFYAELLMMVKAVCNSSTGTQDFSQEAAGKYDGIAAQQQSRFDALRAALKLNDQEKIMLRMIYVEGLSKSATSKAMGLPAHQAGRLVNDALERISQAIKHCGVELDGLLELA